MNSSKSILRQLGKSDLMVTPIGLGAWQFSKSNGVAGKYWGYIDDEGIYNIVKTTLENGINWFDTAEIYGRGESEKALTNALIKLGKTSSNVIIATKWWPVFRRAKSIIETIDKRIDALNNFRIDLYQIHQPYSVSSIKSQMKAMAELVQKGKIRYVGVSNFSAKKMEKAHLELQKYDIPLVSNQVQYNLLNRKIETNGIVRIAKEYGISIIAYSPLAQGILTGKFHENPDLIKSRSGYRKYKKSFKPEYLERTRGLINALKEIGEKYNATPAQVALNWIVNFHSDLVVAIPGASSSKQTESNANTMKFELTQQELNQIDRITTIYR